MPAQKEKGEIEAAKKRPDLGEGGGKSVYVRTVTHGRHFPDLPGGNVGIKTALALKDP